MFNLPEKFVIVDGYRIPADKAEEYRKTKERMEKEAEKFFKGFCEIVKKEPLLASQKRQDYHHNPFLHLEVPLLQE